VIPLVQAAVAASLVVAALSAVAFYLLRPGSPLANFLDYGGSK
jgi:hypothetical protein